MEEAGARYLRNIKIGPWESYIYLRTILPERTAHGEIARRVARFRGGPKHLHE